MSSPAFTGCVLTGGSSVRMGQDKALLEVDGVPLAAIAARALRDAGAAAVFCQGGDAAALAAAGLDTFPDSAPGDGPLAAILDAFEVSATPLLMVLSCDLPNVSAASVRTTVRGVGGSALAAMPTYQGRPQYLHAAYDKAVVGQLRAAHAAGERSLHRALGGVAVATVTVADPATLADADRPADLE